MAVTADAIHEDNLEWSGGTYTVNEIYEHYDFPCLVKACEGIYDPDDIESFSNGDYLKLHGCETIEKAHAYPIEVDSRGQPSKDYLTWAHPLLIPLDYKTRAKVIPNNGMRRRYPTVELLLQDFPRYVKVGPYPIKAQHLQTGETFSVPQHTILELVRKIKDMGTKKVSLICRYNGRELLLDGSCKGDFSIVEDQHTYTLREIVARFPLPQVVELTEDLVQKAQKYLGEDAVSALSNMSKFQGKFVVDKVQSECKIFGTHRLDLEASTEGEESTTKERYRTHQAIVVIPVDSDTLFQVATNRESAIYRTVFSQNYGKSLNTGGIGALYMEIQGTPMSRELFVPLDDSDEEDHEYFYPDPPEQEYLLPCSPKQGSMVASSPQYDTPPTRPPRTDVLKLGKVPPVASKPKVKKRHNPEVKQAMQTYPPRTKLVPATEPVEETKLQNIGLLTGGVKVLPTVQPKPLKQQRTTVKPSATIAPTPKDNSDYEIAPVFQRDISSVLPISQNEPIMNMGKTDPDWRETLKSASVEKIGIYLRDLGLADKVQTFADNDIDGDYLLCLSDNRDVLSSDPFSLIPFQIMKLQKFVKEGKLPNHDKIQN